MILLRTDDGNGKMQFVTVRNDSFYRECKHCGRILPIPSICEYMDDLGEEDFEDEVLDWCGACLDKKYEIEDLYMQKVAQDLAAEVKKKKMQNSLLSQVDNMDETEQENS